MVSGTVASGRGNSNNLSTHYYGNYKCLHVLPDLITTSTTPDTPYLHYIHSVYPHRSHKKINT